MPPSPAHTMDEGSDHGLGPAATSPAAGGEATSATVEHDPGPAALDPVTPDFEFGTSEGGVVAPQYDYFDDGDSAISGDFLSDTTSLKSHILAYRVENGRRYHAYKDGAYLFPNDETQNEQLDIGHHLHTLILDGKLFLAPIGDNPQRVLDLGTGTGIWAIDFADKFPSAAVTGTDLSPIQPVWVPPNVRFETDDCKDEWTYRVNQFDFIHIRNLYGSMRDWPRLYKQAYDHLKPGGWIEQYEISPYFESDDGSVTPDSALSEWNEYANLFTTITGKPINISAEMKALIDRQGFVNTVERVWKAPHGPWPKDPKLKEIGNWGLLELEVGLEGFSMALCTRFLGWSYEAVQEHLTKIRAELRSRHIHSYHYIRCVYGQKPHGT